MSEKTILAPHIAVQPGVRGGRPFVDGKGVAVHHIARESQWCRSVDDIAYNFHLTLAEVYAALAFYFDHKAEIDAWLTEDDRLYDDGRAASVSPLRDRPKHARA